MMSEIEVLESLRDAGAILHGHFELTSGLHSDTYVQCARVLEDPELTSELARAIAAKVAGQEIDAVVSPAIGGIIIGYAVAQALGVRFIFTERQNGTMMFRRGFTIAPGERLLIVEDVVTTGGSVAEVAKLVRGLDGIVVGIASIIDRGGPKVFSEEFYPLLRLEVEAMEPHACALCATGMPIDTPGSRHLQ